MRNVSKTVTVVSVAATLFIIACSKQKPQEQNVADTNTSGGVSAAGTTHDSLGTKHDAANTGSPNVDGVKMYTFYGVPTQIDTAAAMLTIDHEEIQGYMEPMTMSYKVASPDIFSQVTIGKGTHFTIRVAGNDVVIVKVASATQYAANADTSGKDVVKMYKFRGVPTAIDNESMTITLKHEEIQGYMDAMTMPYKVANADLLKQVTVGKETHFTIRVVGNDAVIVKVMSGHDHDLDH